MAKGIIDEFQAIYITDNDCKFICRFLLNGSVDLFLIQQERMLALDPGHRIRHCRGTCFIPLQSSFLLPFVARGVINDHYTNR